jgi:ATP-dependent Clp protease adaptor protein ClpS
MTTAAPFSEETTAKKKTQNTPKPLLNPTWHVLVLNDPVNLMPYVIIAFQKIFGYDLEKAKKHMLEVHQEGQSVVWTGPREKAEHFVYQLQQWQLTALLLRDA